MSEDKDEYIKQLEAQVDELENQLHNFVEINSENYVYKIVNPAGLFSTGGAYPNFTKAGKTWTSIGRAKAHLSMFSSYCKRAPNRRKLYVGCKVVKVSTFIAEDFDILIDHDNGKVSIDV